MFVIDSLYYVAVHSSISTFLRSLIIKLCGVYKGFFYIHEMNKWFLSFLLLMCSIIFIDLHVLNHACIPRIRQTWSWHMIFLICYWIHFAIILWRSFVFMFIKEIDLLFSFLDVSLSGFGMSVILAS
jgi:hypothetical protein